MRADTDKWWKTSVIYQIYPRSFYDSNGDGIGDLQGITEKLDYLQELGVDAVWLSPVYRSPQDDNGYDISDYQDIDPIFGSLEDMDRLIGEAKKRGIRIIMDLVLNHTSDEHPWFREAKKSKDNPYHDFYVWRDGEEGVYPNELKSAFCGPAWEWVPELGQYYLHQFSVKQPDLNWENPKLRKAIYEMINWWIDRGVGGFRLDVIDLIGKETDKMIMAEGKMLHPYLQEMSKETFQKADLVTVGEAWSATQERAMKYSNPDGSELSMVFQFEHILLDQQPGKEKWDLMDLPFVEFKKVFAKWQTSLYNKGWNSLFLSNHDLPRSVSRFGDDGKYRKESAKMLATMIHGMQGTPYIYQGEELGMTNPGFTDISQYRDVESKNHFRILQEKGLTEQDAYRILQVHSRDNSRTPMQWDGGANGGFTTGEPWMEVTKNSSYINAQAELADEDSVFHYYRKLVQLRKDYDVVAYGDFEALAERHPQVFAYRRTYGGEELLVVNNFYGRETVWESGLDTAGFEKLLGNYEGGCPADGKFELRPFETMVLYRKK